MAEPVWFVDTVATRPYDDTTAGRRALGGTEATVCRIAAGLAADRGVVVAQRARSAERRGGDGVRYLPYDHKASLASERQPGSIVVVRAHKLLPGLRRRYPEACLWLWMHCMPGRRLRSLPRVCVETDTEVIAVSEQHRIAMRRAFAALDPVGTAALRIRCIHNPLAPDIPVATQFDRDRLVFASSPHKGLDQVLATFAALRRRCPSMQLRIANPGYLDWPFADQEGVVRLGPLPHREVLRELGNALCLFYPQNRFVETFGLVFAEAHAVGTPVLAHPLGAAVEVIGDPAQLCDAGDVAGVVDRVLRWRDGGRPVPARPERFELPTIVARWRSLLDAGARPTAANPEWSASEAHG